MTVVRSRAPLKSEPTPHTKTPRAKNPPYGFEHLRVRAKSGLWGAGERPVVVCRNWLGAFTRAPPVRDARAFRARGRPLLQAKPGSSPGRFRHVRPFGERTRPLPPAPAEHSVRRGRDVSGRLPGVTPHRRGARPAPQTMRIRRRRLHPFNKGRNRFRPFARVALAPSTAMGQAPALTGDRFHKLPARRYGPRKPELTASRQPKLRTLRPSVGTEGGTSIAWGERVGKKWQDFFGGGMGPMSAM